MQNVVPMVNAPVVDDPLSYYSRQIDGQWFIPLTVDRKDPWVRLLVLGPDQPLLVDIALMVDGQSHRGAREEWIDLLLDQARKKSLIAGALDASTEDGLVNVEKTEEDNSEDVDAVEDESDEEEVPTTEVRRRKAPTVVQRLINYLAAEGAGEDREEIRWLIAEWAGGPSLLALGPAFSWQRAGVAPLWNCLDRDHDRILSASEVEAAFAKLQQADLDEDDVVDLQELERVSEAHSAAAMSPYPRTMSHPLIVVLNEGTAWDKLHRNLVELYGSDNRNTSAAAESTLMARVRRGDSSLTSSDLADLMYVSPELVYRVDLGIDEGKVSLLATGNDPQESDSLVSASEQVITVNLASEYLELTAANGEAESKLDLRRTQIAVGAVVDGYPLFRLLDRDNNRRLTLREQRQLEACLASCDINHDGQIDSTEIPTAIRLTVTHGAHVHEKLRQPTAATREIGSEASEAAPAWFAQMDRNRDGDLSRVEFLGTSDQFKQLDHDQDGLISKKESQDKTTTSE